MRTGPAGIRMRRLGFALAMPLWALSPALLRAETGAADITGTAPGSTLAGTVTFMDTPAGLKVSAKLSRVPPGVHGFHIHEFGECVDEGRAAGNHYNPAGAPHGMAMKPGPAGSHPGDMGNVTADAQGNATLEVTIPRVFLTGGRFNVSGRAVVLHEKPDDYSQPTGNAGGRIGCGPIRITGPVSRGAKAPAAAPNGEK